MSKVTMTFNLPEERMEMQRAVNATDMAIVLFELSRNGKKRFTRHLERVTGLAPEYEEGYEKATEEIFEWVNELMYDHGIVIDDIIE